MAMQILWLRTRFRQTRISEMIIRKELLPQFFAKNRILYAQYGTYYIQSLEHIESTHLVAREEIEDVGLPIHRNKLGIGQSIDLAGEQSCMRSAKTAGTI